MKSVCESDNNLHPHSSGLLSFKSEFDQIDFIPVPRFTFLASPFMEILLRLGFLIDFISVPVIAGFTSAAAITIASSQVLMIKMALNVILAEVVVVVVLVMLLAVLVNIVVLSVAITPTKVVMTKNKTTR